MENGTLQRTGPQAVVVTVHGTWARGAPWARQDSALGQALIRWFAANGFSASVEPFQWSGRNSVNARRDAGIRLAALLQQVKQQAASAEIYVVAHSHGGSVFAYAMKEHPALLPAVNGFVALATPWVGARTSSYAAPFRILMIRLAFFGALLATLVPISLLFNYLVFLNWRPSGGLEGVFVDIGIILALSITAIMYTAAAAAFVALAGFLLWRFWLSARFARTANAFHERLAAWADRANTLDAELPANSVFLKPAGDEAALALGWTSAMAALAQGASALLFWILQVVRDLWLRVPTWIQVIAGVALSIAMVSGIYLAWFTWTMLDENALSALLRKLIGDLRLLRSANESVAEHMFLLGITILELVSLLSWAIFCAFTVTLLLLLVVALVAAAGAGVITPSALFLEFWVEAIPAGDRRLVLVEVRREPPDVDRVARGPLSHSALYSNAAAIDAVTHALTRFRATT